MEKLDWDEILENTGLIAMVVNRHMDNWDSSQFSREEVVANLWVAGYEALGRAIASHDPEKGALSTYAVPALDNAMKKAKRELFAQKGGGKSLNAQHVLARHETPFSELEARGDEADIDTILSEEGDRTDPWMTPGPEAEVVQEIHREELSERLYETIHSLPILNRAVILSIMAGTLREDTCRDLGIGKTKYYAVRDESYAIMRNAMGHYWSKETA